MKEFVIKNKVKILAILLLLSIVGMVTFGVLFATNIHKDKPSIDMGGDVDIEVPEVEEDVVYKLGNINFSEASSIKSVKVEARVYPFNGTDKNVTWSLAFENAESEWAKDKAPTDYITVEPDSKDSRIATVTNKAPFGETIVLTCASVDKPEINVSVKIEHMASVVDVYFKFDYNGKTYEFNKDGYYDGTQHLKIPFVKDKYIEEFTIDYITSDIYSIMDLDIEKVYIDMHTMVFGNQGEKYLSCNYDFSDKLPFRTIDNIANKDIDVHYTYGYGGVDAPIEIDSNFKIKSFEEFFNGEKNISISYPQNLNTILYNFSANKFQPIDTGSITLYYNINDILGGLAGPDVQTVSFEIN